MSSSDDWGKEKPELDPPKTPSTVTEFEISQTTEAVSSNVTSDLEEFGKLYGILDDFNLLLDQERFKAIWIWHGTGGQQNSADAPRVEFDILPGLGKADVYITQSTVARMFIQPILHKRPFRNAKLTSLRFSNECGCCLVDQDVRTCVASLEIENEHEPFSFFLRLRGNSASYWNTQNVGKIEADFVDIEKKLNEHIISHAIYSNEYIWQKCEFSNGVCVSFREIGANHNEMYVENFNDFAVTVTFNFKCSNGFVRPMAQLGDGEELIGKVKINLEIIPSKCRSRLLEVFASEGEKLAWGHDWTWRHYRKSDNDTIQNCWDRFCFLHPFGHASAVSFHDLAKKFQFDDVVSKFSERVPGIGAKWYYFTQFFDDWNSYDEESEKYTCAQYLMYSKEEIQSSFKKTVLSVQSASHLAKIDNIWEIIFDFYPTRNRFLWGSKQIRESFDNTDLSFEIEEADEIWNIIFDFIQW